MRIFVLQEIGLGFISAHKTKESARFELNQIAKNLKLSDEAIDDMYHISEAYLYDNEKAFN